ncbi:MAG: type II toxin-antitoxin system RelE/ParE family toxin [Bdellovibrionales bacterium]
MRFIISEEASNDLEDFGDRAARNDPASAVATMKELLRYCRAIAHAPHAWEPAPDLGEGLRCATYDRWTIYFSAHDDEVRIERLLLGRRRRNPDCMSVVEDIDESL